jgi:hypothetical protein
VGDDNTAAAENALFSRAAAAGFEVICVRSPSKRLPGLIDRAHQAGLKVYAWRWPAVTPQPKSKTHWYADDEAKFVANTLVPAGLDGYMVDPESDSAGAADDWNAKTHATLAARFCKTILSAVTARGSGFRFGTTSGCNYPSTKGKPDIPWTEFVTPSTVLLPQSYWRMVNRYGDQVDINGGAPEKAVARGFSAWKRVAKKTPVVPTAGELAIITAAEITSYGAAMATAGMRELHFYLDGPKFDHAKVAAARAL